MIHNNHISFRIIVHFSLLTFLRKFFDISSSSSSSSFFSSLFLFLFFLFLHACWFEWLFFFGYVRTVAEIDIYSHFVSKFCIRARDMLLLTQATMCMAVVVGLVRLMCICDAIVMRIEICKKIVLNEWLGFYRIYSITAYYIHTQTRKEHTLFQFLRSHTNEHWCTLIPRNRDIHIYIRF